MTVGPPTLTGCCLDGHAITVFPGGTRPEYCIVCEDGVRCGQVIEWGRGVAHG